MMLGLMAVSALVSVGIWLLPNVAAADTADELIDCHHVDCFQRVTCNRRVLAELRRIKTAFPEFRAFQSPTLTTKEITVQLERQERLRSFWAPECKPIAPMPERSASGLAAAWQALSALFAGSSTRPMNVTRQVWSPPLFARPIVLRNEAEANALYGRWAGWITFHDDRSVPLWYQITHVNAVGGYVKACSDHGMVMGSVTKEGVLQLPRSESLSFGSRILLWRSPPSYDDLEGIVLLDVEPDQELNGGVVWLSRALSRADAILPTDYLCQDKEILDRRNKTWIP